MGDLAGGAISPEDAGLAMNEVWHAWFHRIALNTDDGRWFGDIFRAHAVKNYPGDPTRAMHFADEAASSTVTNVVKRIVRLEEAWLWNSLDVGYEIPMTIGQDEFLLRSQSAIPGHNTPGAAPPHNKWVGEPLADEYLSNELTAMALYGYFYGSEKPCDSPLEDPGKTLDLMVQKVNVKLKGLADRAKALEQIRDNR